MSCGSNNYHLTNNKQQAHNVKWLAGKYWGEPNILRTRHLPELFVEKVRAKTDKSVTWNDYIN